MMRAVAITLRSLPKQAVLLDQLFFALDSDKFQQVTAILDAPVADTAGLARLKAIKAPWVSITRVNLHKSSGAYVVKC